MRLKLICCEVLYREICHVVANSPHTVDVEFLPKGLHDFGVEKMAPRLQEQIDALPAGAYDAILLGYGLCNNGVVGLKCGHTRLVIPRAHDCIALFMGSRKKYKEYFNAHPGTYYLTTGWIERNDDSGASDETVSQRLGLSMQYEELVEKYGQENADYIRDTMGDATANYDRLAFIEMGLKCEDPFQRKAEEEAKKKGWTFEVFKGSLELLRRLVDGEWDTDFLILTPGTVIGASHDDEIIRQKKAD